MSEPLTQKAAGIIKGLKELQSRFVDIDGANFNEHFNFFTHTLINKKIIKDLDAGLTWIAYPKFARPCPMTPRHGFVESRTVYNNKELISLYKETMEQDTNGEVVIGEHFDSVLLNAIYVSSGVLSVGPGNDGATGGKNSVSLCVAPNKISDYVCAQSKINKKDAVYIEAILPINYKNWAIVQLRGGPKISVACADFTPKDVTIKKIVAPHNNLLEWESQVKKFNKGTVVYGPGHTLASHAAIHCVLNNVPFMVSREPKIGETIKATEKKNSIIFSRRQFKKGVAHALNSNIVDVFSCEATAVKFCLTILHNWAYLRKSPFADFFLGMAAATLSIIGSALCFGEGRYVDSNLIGAREKIYQRVFNRKQTYLNNLPRLFKLFSRANSSSGVGGIPWANCTFYTNLIWRAVASIYKRKNNVIGSNEINRLVGAINRTINLAHNNGWWFNKIASAEMPDFVAENPGVAALSVAHIFYDLMAIANVGPATLTIKPANKIRTSYFGKDSNGNIVWPIMYLSKKYNGALYNFSYSRQAKVFIKKESRKNYFIKTVSLSAKELRLAKMSATQSDLVPLKIISDKGFLMPGGRMIKYRGIKRIY